MNAISSLTGLSEDQARFTELVAQTKKKKGSTVKLETVQDLSRTCPFDFLVFQKQKRANAKLWTFWQTHIIRYIATTCKLLQAWDEDPV